MGERGQIQNKLFFEKERKSFCGRASSPQPGPQDCQPWPLALPQNGSLTPHPGVYTTISTLGFRFCPSVLQTFMKMERGRARRRGGMGRGQVQMCRAGQQGRRRGRGVTHCVSWWKKEKPSRAGHTWPIRCLSNLYSLGNWLLIYLPILSPRGGQKVTKQSPQSLIQKDTCFSSYSEKLKTLLGHFRNFKIEISMHPVRHLSCSQ